MTFTGGRSYVHSFTLYTWNERTCNFVLDPTEQVDDLLAFVQPLQGHVLKNKPGVNFVYQHNVNK